MALKHPQKMRKIAFVLLMISNIAQSQIKPALNNYLSQLPATTIVSMQVEAISGKIFFTQNAEKLIPSASIIKIPILVELMENVKVGKIKLTDEHILVTKDKAGGSGRIANMKDGEVLTINELAKQMIVASDNTATNILIQKLGRNNINDRMKKLGFADLQLNRLMMDTAAVKRGEENYVSANQINQLLRLIYNKKLATPALCKTMIDFLLANEDTATLPRNLPKTLKIAHKTGGLTYVRGDAGIVFSKKPFIISVLVQGTNTENAEQIIGEIGKICYEHLQ